jgi:hypothetical protein
LNELPPKLTRFCNSETLSKFALSEDFIVKFSPSLFERIEPENFFIVVTLVVLVCKRAIGFKSGFHCIKALPDLPGYTV